MPHVPPEAPLSRTDDRRTLLLALGAAGVTLAVVLVVIGLPAVNACSADPRGVITCLRDMADRKFDLPGSIPGQVAETAPIEVPLPTIVAETKAPAASGGPLEAPAVEPAAAPIEPVVPAPVVEPPADPQPVEFPAETASLPPAATDMAAPPEPEPAPLKPEEPAALELETVRPDDTALTWSTHSLPQEADMASGQAEPVHAEAPTTQHDEPTAPVAAPSAQAEPAPSATTKLLEDAAVPATAPPPQAAAPPAAVQPKGPLVLANAEPATSQPPAPTIAAPVILAPTIDAIELDAEQSFVSGSGPAGALMRLYADGELIGESPVEEGRWLIEGSNLLDGPRRELRVEAIEPDTGKLLGVAAITVEIELPDGGTPPDERPEQAPDLGSGVAPAPSTAPASPIAAAPIPALPPSTLPPELADSEPPVTTAVPDAEPTDGPALVIDPEPSEPEPELAAVAPEVRPEALPPLATVVPRGESASVEILAPSTLEPTTLPPVDRSARDHSSIAIPTPDAPALIAEFDVGAPQPAPAPGQPVTILRLLPFGDPDEGRYNVGKAIIRRGDTLWSIARRYYGHGIHYRTIFHANRELIRRPSRIFPGQIFDLPLVTDD